MSSLTHAQARAEIFTLIKAAWDTTGLPMLYEGVTGDPPKSGSWARATVHHVGGRQASLTGGLGTRRFEREGIVIIQVFTEVGKGLSLNDPLDTILVDALEGQATDGGVWFRNVTANEVGKDGPWQQTNVTADFTYDQIK